LPASPDDTQLSNSFGKRLQGSTEDADTDLEDSHNLCLAANGDSTKAVGYEAAMTMDDGEGEEVEECDEGWENELENEIFCEKMIKFCQSDDDDWVPYRQRWVRSRKERKSTFLPNWTSSCLLKSAQSPPN
jgi:hypothetical protein